jgi:N-alpha-acetyltransferase 40
MAKRAARKALSDFEQTRTRSLREAKETLQEKLSALGPLLHFSKRGLDAEVSLASAETCGDELLTTLFDLVKSNMKKMYDSSPGWHWNDAKKREELRDEDTRYLIVRSSGAVVAFASFRFHLEGDFDVLYLYELQLSEHVQRRGLGRHLMALVECIARQQGMQRVMLTVLKSNPAARDFYCSMRYSIDESSASDDEGAPHEIMSKVVNKVAEAQRVAILEGLRSS